MYRCSKISSLGLWNRKLYCSLTSYSLSSEKLWWPKRAVLLPTKRNVVCLIIASYAYKIKLEMQFLSHAIVHRIEGWWSQLRRFKMPWWIDLLKVTSLVCN